MGSSVGRGAGNNYTHRQFGDEVVQYVLLSGQGIFADSQVHDILVMTSCPVSAASFERGRSPQVD